MNEPSASPPRPGGRTPSPYLTGIRLAGREVLVVGGGRVAERRVPALLAAGADVHLVSPALTDGLAVLASAGEVCWQPRAYVDGDLGAAWYVLAATDDAAVNAAVSAEAEGARVFCVRADDASTATAWTPASVEVHGVQIGVLAGGDPRRSRAVRDRVAALLAGEALAAAPSDRDHSRDAPTA